MFVYSVALSCILFCSVFVLFSFSISLVLLCNSGNDSRVFATFFLSRFFLFAEICYFCICFSFPCVLFSLHAASATDNWIMFIYVFIKLEIVSLLSVFFYFQFRLVFVLLRGELSENVCVYWCEGTIWFVWFLLFNWISIVFSRAVSARACESEFSERESLSLSRSPSLPFLVGLID